MMRRESIHVDGLCSRIAIVTTHCEDDVMLNDKDHMRATIKCKRPKSKCNSLVSYLSQ